MTRIGRHGAADHLRPRFHVRPAVGYVNDPNGPVVVGGVTHLYFQSRATTEMEDPVRWGHVTTTDLVRWHEQPTAMRPGRTGALDADGCWSGNTVIDPRGHVRAFYSGFRRDRRYQSVLTAASADGGTTFGSVVPAVPDPGSSSGIEHFRDPFVWRSRRSGRWRMVVGAGHLDGRASAQLYGSADLVEWTHLGALLTFPRTRVGDVDTGAMWECPQVVEVDGDEHLLIGAWSTTEGTMRTYAIRTDRAEPRLQDFRPIDDGPDFYAPSVLRSSTVGPVLFGWAREARSSDWADEDGWSGVLTLPRVVSTDPAGGLRYFPVPAFDTLRAGPGRTLGRGVGHQVDAQCEAAVVAAPGRTVLLTLRFGPKERLTIEVDHQRNAVIIDRDEASVDPRAAGGVTVLPDAFDDSTGLPDARVLVDGSIVEVFTSGGRAATLRCYPRAAPPWSIEVGANEGSAIVWALDPDGPQSTQAHAERRQPATWP